MSVFNPCNQERFGHPTDPLGSSIEIDVCRTGHLCHYCRRIAALEAQLAEMEKYRAFFFGCSGTPYDATNAETTDYVDRGEALRDRCEELAKQLAERDEEVGRLKAKLVDRNNFLAGCSLCEECQKKREERAIIATPRIQVEEDRDRLRAQLAELEAEVGRLSKAIHTFAYDRDYLCDWSQTPEWWALIEIADANREHDPHAG